jgi:flagellar motor switch protein FliM
MSSQIELPRPFDFRKPCRLAINVERHLASWQEQICSFAVERWKELLPCDVKWNATPPETAHLNETETPPSSIGQLIHVGQQKATTLLLMPRLLANSTVNGMMGQTNDDGPTEDRGLTTLELSVFEVAMQATAEAIYDAQLADNQRPISLGPLHPNPRLKRILLGEPEIVILRFQIELGSSSHECSWIWSEALVEELVEDDDETATVDDPDAQELLGVAQRIPLEVVVRLGSAKLHVSELANLRAGDVVVLNRRVSDSLSGFIEGKELFEGWPGRVGVRQAIQIKSMGAD